MGNKKSVEQPKTHPALQKHLDEKHDIREFALKYLIDKKIPEETKQVELFDEISWGINCYYFIPRLIKIGYRLPYLHRRIFNKAFKHGDVEVVKKLTTKSECIHIDRIDKYTINDCVKTVIKQKYLNGDERKILKILLEHSDFYPDPELLISAVNNCNKDAAEMLIKNGINPNIMKNNRNVLIFDLLNCKENNDIYLMLDWLCDLPELNAELIDMREYLAVMLLDNREHGTLLVNTPRFGIDFSVYALGKYSTLNDFEKEFALDRTKLKNIFREIDEVRMKRRKVLIKHVKMNRNLIDIIDEY